MKPSSVAPAPPILRDADDMVVKVQEICFHIIMNGHANAVVFACADEIPIPSSFNEAMASNEKHQWIAAMQAEIESLSSNGVFSETPLPADHRALKGMRVFAHKTDAQGAVERLKARCDIHHIIW
jgi:hypothetical protein